MYQLTVSE